MSDVKPHSPKADDESVEMVLDAVEALGESSTEKLMQSEALRVAILRFPSGPKSSRSVGRTLANLRGVLVNGRWLASRTGHSRVTLWSVMREEALPRLADALKAAERALSAEVAHSAGWQLTRAKAKLDKLRKEVGTCV